MARQLCSFIASMGQADYERITRVMDTREGTRDQHIIVAMNDLLVSAYSSMRSMTASINALEGLLRYREPFEQQQQWMEGP